MSDLLAHKIFDAEAHLEGLKHVMYNKLTNIFCGCPDFDTCVTTTDHSLPFEDFSWYYYDQSLELEYCKQGLELTPEQVEKIKALGFKTIYVNRLKRRSLGIGHSRY